MMLTDRRRRHWPALALAVACLLATGCVERRYTIRTEPPGALVVVNGEEIGPSPVSRSFTFYGAREITLMQDGYQTQTLIQPIKAPWWDNLLTEFFTENLIPVTFRDERDFTYRMAPVTTPATGDLLDRAESLKAQGQAGPPPRRGGILGFFGF
jgi:hypothetical protein